MQPSLLARLRRWRIEWPLAACRLGFPASRGMPFGVRDKEQIEQPSLVQQRENNIERIRLRLDIGRRASGAILVTGGRGTVRLLISHGWTVIDRS